MATKQVKASEKVCAMFRQSWYEAARKRMKDGARLAFYEFCFEYEFYRKEPAADDLFAFDDALLAFEMARNELDRDMERAERITMRNRRNGLLGGRPAKGSEGGEIEGEELSKSTKPKKTQRNPQKPTGFFGGGTTLQYNNTTKQEQSISSPTPSPKARRRAHKDIDTYTRFCVMFVFFYSGANDPAAECAKFYDYYAARDWMVGRNQPVKDKVALARTWEIKDSNPGLIDARRIYSGLIEAIDPEEPELLTDFVALMKDDEAKKITLRMRNGNRISSILETRYLALMAMYFRNKLQLDGYDLIYDYV